MQKESKKILVINVNWLGDVLFSTPALKALRRYNPQAHITCLVIARCQEVLKNNPCVDEIIIYDEYGKHRSFLSKIRLIRSLRKKKFDQVFILHQSLKRAMIGFLAGIPERIGYNTKGRGFLLSKVVPLSEKPLHKIDYFLQLFESCGIKTDDRKCEFFIDENDSRQAKDILNKIGISDNEQFVILNPGGNWSLKRWPVGNFAKLADLLIDKKKVKIILAGSKKDMDLAEEISSVMKNKPHLISGKTTLSQLAAIMVKARCVVSADSGPMHIAVSAGANTVAIFGPTSLKLTGPVGKGKVIILQKEVGCEVPCYKLDCRDNRCMKAVTPEEVLNSVCEFLT